MDSTNYKILLRAEPEGGYTVFVPGLEGCITYGKDIEEAKNMAKEAIALYIVSLKEDGLPVPKDEDVLELNLEVNNA